MKHLSAFCDLPFRKVTVNAGGDVSMCCHQQGILGNLFADTFDAIWRSALAEEVRMATLGGRLHPMCAVRDVCPFLYRPKTETAIALEHAYPTILELDLPNTHCNIGGTTPTPDTACFMCPRSAVNFFAEPDRSLELTDHLRFLMPYLSEIRIQGVAEPFWKGRVFEVLERLDFPQYRNQCAFNAYTNGSVFHAACRAQFIDLCPKARLFFSIDAATPETYRVIRRLPLFERVVSNIREFVRERGPNQSVEIANNLNLLNLHEARQMVELAADLGVEIVQFNPTHDGGTGRTDIRHLQVGPDNYRQFERAEEEIHRRGRELGIQVIFTRPLALNFGTIGSATPRIPLRHVGF